MEAERGSEVNEQRDEGEGQERGSEVNEQRDEGAKREG